MGTMVPEYCQAWCRSTALAHSALTTLLCPLWHFQGGEEPQGKKHFHSCPNDVLCHLQKMQVWAMLSAWITPSGSAWTKPGLTPPLVDAKRGSHPLYISEDRVVFKTWQTAGCFFILPRRRNKRDAAIFTGSHYNTHSRGFLLYTLISCLGMLLVAWLRDATEKRCLPC